MATIKSCTDLSQSKKLSEILPLESADMHYHYDNDFGGLESIPTITEEDDHFVLFPKDVRCWSLAALLGVLPLVDFTTPQLIGTPKTFYRCMYNDDLKSHAYDNPVDACYEMIIKLNELNLL